MYQNYLEQYLEENEETILDDTIDQFHDDQERRNEELFRFIDEFINSEEYEEYMEHKRNILKRDVSVQYCIADLEQQDVYEVPEDKYPLTTQSRKMFAFIKQFEKYINDKRNLEVLKKQQNGINAIKEKIAEIKKINYCTKEPVIEQIEKKNKQMVEDFCESFDVDVPHLTLKVKSKIREKVLCYRKIVHSRNLKAKHNYIEIIKKLTLEYKRQREIDEMLNKTYTYKVTKRERIMKDMDVIGEKIILKPRYEFIEEIVEEQVEVLEDVEEVMKAPKGKKDKEKKDKGKTKGKKDKGSKKSKSTKGKQSKSSKGKKKEDTQLVLPLVPKCNLRKRVGPESYDRLVYLVREFEQLDNVLENKHMLAQDTNSEDFYDCETNLLCTPAALNYRNFERGKVYKKKVKILNISPQFQKFRLKRITCKNQYDSLTFRIEPLIGIQKLAPGCFLQFTVAFTPEDEFTPIEGKLTFVSYDTKALVYRRFILEIQCVPAYSDLKIYPPIINFGKIPIWRANNEHFKRIKLTNDSKKPCTLVIKKVFDPLELCTISEEDMAEEPLEEEHDEACVKGILKECIENIFNKFRFQDLYVKLDGYEKFNMNIKFINVDHIGSYFEEYVVDVYETKEYNTNEQVGCQEIFLCAEITEHFIKASPDILDFGICILDSVYQLSFEVYNDSTATQGITVKFPSIMVDYIKSDLSMTYLPPQGKRTVWLKFLPRKDIFTDNIPYYDKINSILEFPAYTCVLSKTFPDAPPVKITIFAILSTQKCLAINPSSTEFCRYFEDEVTLNLGECTLYETVFSEIQIKNNTLAPQIYGFIDLPECLTVTPNYGFGDILPNETRNLKIYFHPDVKDISSCFAEGSNNTNRINFRITLETVSYIGHLKKEFNYKKLRKSFQLVMKELRSSQNTLIIQDIQDCVDAIKLQLTAQNLEEEEDVQKALSDVCRHIEEYYGEAEAEPIHKSDFRNQASLTKLWLHANIVTPLMEFSHQCVEFSNTPCGSYSTIEIELVTLNTEYELECDTLRGKSKPSVPDYEASFKITGETEEINIEPTCGIIRNGEVKKLMLIVTPKTPEEIILKTATTLKYSEVYERKRQEYEIKRQKQLEKAAEKKGKKDKKGKKEGSKKTEKSDKKSKKGKGKSEESGTDAKEVVEREPQITITEKELQLDYLDFYPAEMFYWRSLHPYVIKTKFTCTINYKCDAVSRKGETLFLDAFCTVIKPDFITNLKQQRIDFGKVAIGMKSMENIIIQNISYDDIRPKFTLWNPFGPFSMPHIKDMNIPSEHFLQLPIIFQPTDDGQVEEYFEIGSGGTTLPLIFQGVGQTPKINITPNYLVYRLETKKKDIVECPFEIKNKSECEITITVEKLFELQGLIKEIPKEEFPDATKKGAKNKKEKGNKAAKTKSPKIEIFSNALTESEIASFENYFSTKNDDIYFDIMSAEGNTLNIKPNGTKGIKICFGIPEVLLKKKEDFIKKLSQKGKGKKDKGDKKGKVSKDSKSKSSKSGKDSKKGKKANDNTIYYVAKYNFMLNTVLVKDVILICAFIGK